MTPRAKILLDSIKESFKELAGDCWTVKLRTHLEKIQWELGLLEEELHEVNEVNEVSNE